MDEETAPLDRIADALERLADNADLLKLGFIMMLSQDPTMQPVLQVLANEHLHEPLLDSILAPLEVDTMEDLQRGHR